MHGYRRHRFAKSHFFWAAFFLLAWVPVVQASNTPVNAAALQITLQNLVELIGGDFKLVLCPEGFVEADSQMGVLAMKNCRSTDGGQTIQLSELSTGRVAVAKLDFDSDKDCAMAAVKETFPVLEKGKLQEGPNDLEYILKGSDLVPGISTDVSVVVGCSKNSQSYHALITDKAVISF
jgi:hypothetical protein